MNRPRYEYRCGTCRSTELMIRPVRPGSTLHPYCFVIECSNGHRLTGMRTYPPKTQADLLEFRKNRRR